MVYYKLTKNMSLKRDIIIMFLIVILPFLFYLYNLAPKGQEWETSLFTINAGLYENVDYFVWLFCIKILTFLILCLWFLTSVNKWKYVLLVSIFLEMNKFSNIVIGSQINLPFKVLDINIYAVLFSIPFFILLLWVNSKLAYSNSEKSISSQLNEEINNEYDRLTNFDIKTYTTVKNDLTRLEKQKQKLSKKEYLNELIATRDRLSSL